MSVLGKINDTLSDWTSKTSVLAAVIHNLVQTDAQAVFDFVRTLENDTHNTVIMNVVNAWARLDPEAALAAVQSRGVKELAQFIAKQHRLFVGKNQSTRSAGESGSLAGKRSKSRNELRHYRLGTNYSRRGSQSHGKHGGRRIPANDGLPSDECMGEQGPNGST